MKIVGRTGKYYLASIDEAEIVKIMGFGSCYSEEWRTLVKTALNRKDYSNLEGLEVSVDAIYDRTSRIRNDEAKVRQSIETMRALADALESAWPSLTLSKE